MRRTVSTTPPAAELQSTLEDTQASLAAALARIEVYRKKNKELQKELLAKEQASGEGKSNDGPEAPTDQQATDSARTTDSGDPVQSDTTLPPRVPSTIATVSSKDLYRKNSLKQSSSSGSLHRTVSNSSLKNAVPTQQPLFFYHGDTKTKGFVLAREGCLEFYEMKACITPPQFVGVAAVDDPNYRTVDVVDGSDENAQHWFDLGWLFHPQEVISNLSHYLADTFGENEAEDAETYGGHSAKSWAQEMDTLGGVQLAQQGGSATVSQSEASATEMTAPTTNVMPQSSSADPPTPPSVPASSGVSVDFSRWELPVGRKGGRSETWELLWKEHEGDGKLKRMVFEGSTAACAFITKQVESWHMSPGASAPSVVMLAGPHRLSSAGSAALNTEQTTEEKQAAALQEDSGVDEPLHLVPGTLNPQLSEPSNLLSETQVKAIATALPSRYRLSNWGLVYSTLRHGISLHTMYRKASGVSPTILVVRDTAGWVFGAYTSQAWHMAPRYYGTGETFVFQLQPHMVAWHWHRRGTDAGNNFFIFSCHDSIAVGGGSDFALWLDQEFNHGHSGTCDTFGSPSLSSEEDFKIAHVELWTPL